MNKMMFSHSNLSLWFVEIKRVVGWLQRRKRHVISGDEKKTIVRLIDGRPTKKVDRGVLRPKLNCIKWYKMLLINHPRRTSGQREFITPTIRQVDSRKQAQVGGTYFASNRFSANQTLLLWSRTNDKKIA